MDWYAYTHPPATNFAPTSVKATVYDNRLVAVARDVSLLFPQGATVIEITDDTATEDVLAVYGGQIYDPVANTLSPPPPQEPAPFTNRRPTIVAAAFNIHVADFDIPSIDGLFNIAAAVYLDVGSYMVFFVQPQPDAAYYAVITGDAPAARLSDQAPEYFTIETKDGPGGNPIDPAVLSVQIMRIDQ
ncbi:hypothetical protein [Bradyrhizobium sp. Leo121]|uniref:hypothetical protein n=1 Tax=Bradyrhizobium sp. Leo121 TaxID=1571195 RepID=UPI00102A85DD|nr:hypothetical protein [Bradyrhizobium sp. Leo121]